VRYRLRVGDYRVIYEVQDDVLLVLVIHLGHRPPFTGSCHTSAFATSDGGKSAKSASASRICMRRG